MASNALAKKKETVKNLKESLSKAKLAVISDYKGFTVKEITDLRKRLYKEKAELKVVKNTVLSRAMDDAAYPSNIKDQMKGTTALLLGYGDPVSPLKIVVDFIKEIEKGDIRSGLIESTYAQKDDLVKISKLPGREVLIAKVVGGMKSPMYGLVNVLQGTIRGLVYALNAYKDKKGVS
jgi:large subunit ribosomal protein L10